MNELEKCMAGQYYDCHDPIFLEFKTRARELLKTYHALTYEQKEEKETCWCRAWDGGGGGAKQKQGCVALDLAKWQY